MEEKEEEGREGWEKIQKARKEDEKEEEMASEEEEENKEEKRKRRGKGEEENESSPTLPKCVSPRGELGSSSSVSWARAHSALGKRGKC